MCVSTPRDVTYSMQQCLLTVPSPNTHKPVDSEKKKLVDSSTTDSLLGDLGAEGDMGDKIGALDATSSSMDYTVIVGDDSDRSSNSDSGIRDEDDLCLAALKRGFWEIIGPLTAQNMRWWAITVVFLVCSFLIASVVESLGVVRQSILFMFRGLYLDNIAATFNTE